MTLIRVRATNKPGKAHRIYEELRASGRMAGGVTIVRLGAPDEVHVITELQLADIMWFLYAATKGVEHSINQQDAAAHVLAFNEPMPSEFPSDVTRVSRRRRPSEIKRATDGTLEAPKGESFIFCGECGASKWLATESEAGPVARLACAACGNELKMVTAHPSEGRA